jgi:conflict system STAND superfamily ATPase
VDCPYKGLASFGEGDAAFFFGRQREARIVTSNLRTSRLTVLYAAGGVGKTSLLRAGVAHPLRLAGRRIQQRN